MHAVNQGGEAGQGQQQRLLTLSIAHLAIQLPIQDPKLLAHGLIQTLSAVGTECG